MFFDEVIGETDFGHKVPLLFGYGLDSDNIVVSEKQYLKLRHVKESNKFQVINLTADQAQSSEFIKGQDWNVFDNDTELFLSEWVLINALFFESKKNISKSMKLFLREAC